MNYNNIKISNKQAEEILFDFYHIKGTAFKLPGETDFNFKISIDSKDCYILKISRPNQSKKYSDFQEKLLQYLEDKATIVSPKIILDKKRNASSEYIDSSKNVRSVRLLTWIPGRLWSSVNPQTNFLRFNLGQQCGKLTKTLRFFKHTEAYRNFEWDIAQILMQKRHTARSAVFDEITNQYVKLAEQEFYDEERRQRLEDKEQNNDFFASITSYGRYDVFDPHDAKIAASKVIAQLKSGKTDQIEKAQVQIKADLPSPETILAVVYETGSKYRELDDVLSDLEKRRRRILEDYQNLQNARAIDVKAAE